MMQGMEQDGYGLKGFGWPRKAVQISSLLNLFLSVAYTIPILF